MADMESDIQALGRRLLAAAEEREPLSFSPQWWQEHLLAWATSDPDFRVKLLRFVDVLPTLRTATAVADHIRQYFRGDDVPLPIQIGAELTRPAIFRPLVSKVVRESVFAMAHRFIAGETPEQAVARLRQLSVDGVAYTVDLLGEATLSEKEADIYARRYSELIETLVAQAPGPTTGVWDPAASPAGSPTFASPPVNISVKLSALSSHFEPASPESVSETVRSRLVPLLQLARQRNAFINVDMEQYRYKDLVQHVFADTLRLSEFRDFSSIGIVVQAYLKSAESDIEFLRKVAEERGAPFSVRLVKGAYWEEERIVADQNSWDVPVFEDKAATDASYERCTDRLLGAWPHLRPCFGTHNPRSVAQVAVKSEALGLKHAIEFQMLLGMADSLRDAVVAEGFRTRVYVPVGAVIPGMAYLVRRLLENTSNQSWFIREAQITHPEDILAPPASEPRPVRTVQVRPEHLASETRTTLSPTTFVNTPPAEFHRPDVRAKMLNALARLEATMPLRHGLSLAGHDVLDRTLEDVRYPARPDLLLGQVAQATVADVDTAVAAAREAFATWSATSVVGRAAILRRAAAIMEERRYDLAALMVYESAKPWHEADGDVVEAIDYLLYYADEAERLLAPQPMGQVMGEDNVYLREPRGVAAIIAPWNFPLAIICGMSSAALAAGNCAILKPAGQSPLIAARLVEILHEAGVPASAVQYLPGPGGEVGQALVGHPGVETIAFTGSKGVGLGIIRAAAEVRPGQRQVKRVIAEMGGKNAIIVDEDADLDQAVSGVLVSAFGYAGQKCSACSRLIVVGSAYDEVIERLTAAVESLVVGPSHDPSTFVAPVINKQAQTKIQDYIDEGKQTARLLVHGRLPDDATGYYIAPTVFGDVSPDDRLAREEIFGPVLSVFRVANMDEALKLALDSEFALTGGLYSRNPRNIERARREFTVGNLYINRKVTGAVVGRQPFGGRGLSGAGDKAGGPDYLLQFVQPRTVTENTTRRGFAPEGVGFGGNRAQ